MIKSSCADNSPRNRKVGPKTEARGAASGTRASGARGSAARGTGGERGSTRASTTRASARGSRGSGRVAEGSGAAPRPLELLFIMGASPSRGFLNQDIVRQHHRKL